MLGRIKNRKTDIPSGYPRLHKNKYLRENPGGKFYWAFRIYKKWLGKYTGWPGVYEKRYWKEDRSQEFYFAHRVQGVKHRKFYCPAPGEEVQCQTCGQYKSRDRFTPSKFIPGNVYPWKCHDCINFEKCPNPKTREEINAEISRVKLEWWAERKKNWNKNSRVNQLDYRQKLPDKKEELPANYPVWE